MKAQSFVKFLAEQAPKFIDKPGKQAEIELGRAFKKIADKYSVNQEPEKAVPIGGPYLSVRSGEISFKKNFVTADSYTSRFCSVFLKLGGGVKEPTWSQVRADAHKAIIKITGYKMPYDHGLWIAAADGTFLQVVELTGSAFGGFGATAFKNGKPV